MKAVLLLCLFFMNDYLFGQDCKLNRKTDPYTKQQTLSTGFIELEGGSLTIDANKTEVDLLFSIRGADKCYSDNSMAAIFFAGSKLKQSQRNSGSMNCEGLFHFIFPNRTTQAPLLRKMSTQKVEKFVFTGNDKKETIITLTPEQQQTLMELTACMVANAPTLIK